MDYFHTFSYFLKGFPRRTVAVLLAALAIALLEMLSMSMLLPMIALGAGSGTSNPLIDQVRDVVGRLGLSFDFTTLFLGLAAAFGAKIIVELILGIFIANSSVLIARNFRSRIISALQNVFWGYLTEKPHGLVANLLTQEVDRAASAFSAFQKVTVSTLTSMAYIVVGLTASFKLLLAALVMGVAGVLIARPMMTMARRAGVEQIESLRSLSSDLIQGMQALKAFKAMGRDKQLLGTLSAANDSFMDANLLRTRAEQYLHASQQLLFLAAVVMCVFSAQALLGVGLVEIGFIGLILMRFNAALANQLKKLQAIRIVHYALFKVDDFILELVNNAETAKGGAEPKFPAPICLRDVTFRRGSRKVLSGMDLTIPKSGLTAIVGPSGSGKTTVIDLICGFHAPDEGRIMLGNQNLAEVNLKQWREAIGYVSQEPVLLQDTIRRNISAFDSSLSDEDILRALKLAGGQSILKALEFGLATPAGIAGQKLSGGERQRITIARALAKSPRLLILDEPTAALDSASEKEIIRTVRQISRKIPVVVITHQSGLAEVAEVRYFISRGKATRARAKTWKAGLSRQDH